jgi:hypothetical protein
MPNCHRGSTLAFHLSSFAHLGVHLEVLLQSDRCTHSPPTPSSSASSHLLYNVAAPTGPML